ncbi:MAG TPA: hypothetical protein VKA37_12650 [Halobacteriales archaeon]|nr:hypothetical protein [Halobacteriales archaeon]
MADEYRGIPGAFVSAFRRSDSYLLRAYVLASVVVGVFVTILLALGVVTWLSQPAPLGQRALLGVIAIFVLVPLFAPVLVVARRHRRGVENRRADALLGVVGFGFLLAVYLAGLISAPDLPQQSGALASVVATLDALPRSYWVVPPLLSAASIWLAVRLTRPEAGTEQRQGREPDTSPDDAGDRAEG